MLACMIDLVRLNDQQSGDYLDICAQGDMLRSLWEQQCTMESHHQGKQKAPELPAYKKAITDLVGLLIRAYEHGLESEYINDAMLQHLPTGLFERLTRRAVLA